MRVSFGHESQNIISYIDVHVQVLLNAFCGSFIKNLQVYSQGKTCRPATLVFIYFMYYQNSIFLFELFQSIYPRHVTTFYKVSCILLYLFGQVVNILHRIILQRCILSSLTFKCLCVSFYIFWEIGTWVRWHEDMNRMVSCKVAQFAFSFVL